MPRRNLALLQGRCNNRQHAGLLWHCRCSIKQTTVCRATAVAMSGSPGAPRKRCTEPAVKRLSALTIAPCDAAQQMRHCTTLWTPCSRT